MARANTVASPDIYDICPRRKGTPLKRAGCVQGAFRDWPPGGGREYIRSRADLRWCVRRGHETGLTNHEDPLGCSPGGPRYPDYAEFQLKVVTTPPHVCQELSERRPVNDVRAPFGVLAVPHCGDAWEVSRNLHATAVMRGHAGLPPDGLRQVGHQSLHSLCEFFEVHSRVPWFERGITRPLERLDVTIDGLCLAYFLDGVVSLHEDQWRLIGRKVED